MSASFAVCDNDNQKFNTDQQSNANSKHKGPRKAKFIQDPDELLITSNMSLLSNLINNQPAPVYYQQAFMNLNFGQPIIDQSQIDQQSHISIEQPQWIPVMRNFIQVREQPKQFEYVHQEENKYNQDLEEMTRLPLNGWPQLQTIQANYVPNAFDTVSRGCICKKK